MATITPSDSAQRAQIIELVMRERSLALSTRELRHRLAGYGLGIRDTLEGAIIEKLPNRTPVCTMPAEFGH